MEHRQPCGARARCKRRQQAACRRPQAGARRSVACQACGAGLTRGGDEEVDAGEARKLDLHHGWGRRAGTWNPRPTAQLALGIEAGAGIQTPPQAQAQTAGREGRGQRPAASPRPRRAGCRRRRAAQRRRWRARSRRRARCCPPAARGRGGGLAQGCGGWTGVFEWWWQVQGRPAERRHAACAQSPVAQQPVMPAQPPIPRCRRLTRLRACCGSCAPEARCTGGPWARAGPHLLGYGAHALKVVGGGHREAGLNHVHPCRQRAGRRGKGGGLTLLCSGLPNQLTQATCSKHEACGWHRTCTQRWPRPSRAAADAHPACTAAWRWTASPCCKAGQAGGTS